MRGFLAKNTFEVKHVKLEKVGLGKCFPVRYTEVKQANILAKRGCLKRGDKSEARTLRKTAA